MATMYETIMSLPLFKGISRQQVSTFLEKTHVQFINYNPGERIVSVGDACTHIRYIISGEVVVTSNNYSGNLVIEENARQARCWHPNICLAWIEATRLM